MNRQEALSILGLVENCNIDDIKKAYHSLALKNHPDKGGNSQDFIKIKTAYELLTSHSSPCKSVNGNYWTGTIFVSGWTVYRVDATTY